MNRSVALLVLSVLPVFAQTSTTTTLQSSAATARYGQAVALTATVSDPNASGKTAFYDGGTILGTVVTTGGAAEISEVLLSAGMHSLYARYLGDGGFGASQSGAVHVTILANSTPSWTNAVSYPTDFIPTAFAMGDLNGDGKTDVVAVGTSVEVFLGNGDGTFTESFHATLTSPATATAIADFNTDGKSDVVVSSAAGITVFAGNGDGTLQAGAVTSIPGAAGLIVVSDFNLDGNPDLALPSGALLLGNGDGTFRQGVAFSSSAVAYVVTGDFNVDGKPDLASVTGETLTTFLGNGDGTFQAPLNNNLLEYVVNGTTVVGDLNNDGIPDLIVEIGGANVLIGNGDGTFQGAFYVGFGESLALTLADLNGDGFLDQASFANYASTSIGPFNPTPSPSSGVPGPVISSTAVLPDTTFAPGYMVVAADLTGNGRTDFVYIVPGDVSFYVSLGFVSPIVTLSTSTGTALYGQSVTLTATFTPPSTSGTVTFYDGSAVVGSAAIVGGVASLVSANLPPGTQQLSAHLLANSTRPGATSNLLAQSVAPNLSAGLSIGGSFQTGSEPIAIDTGDFNRDGITDLVVANSGDTTVSILLGKGDGTFQPAVGVTSGANPVGVVVSDFNGDGIPDLAVANGGDDSVSLLLGNGDGTFRLFQHYTGPTETTAIVVADFTGDGIPDLAVGGFNGDLFIFPGLGNGTFGAPVVTFGVLQGLESLAAGDFHQNGMIDLAVSAVPLSDGTDGSFEIGAGNNSGYFNFGGAYYSDISAPTGFAVGDYNGDGAADLAFANYGTPDTEGGNTVGIVFNRGKPYYGSPLGSPQFFNAGTEPLLLVSGDVTGLGHQDIVVTNLAGVSVLRGNGDGTFQAPVNYTTSSSYAVAIGDFNRDGVVDVAVTNVFENDVEILLGVPGTCIYQISPGGAVYTDSNGGSVPLSIQPNGLACSWTATVSDPWMTASQGRETGAGGLTVAVQPNTTGADRTGSIQIAGQSISLTERDTAQVFNDVPASDYYFDAVNPLAAKSITAGCGNDDYCPTSSVTRDQMAIFLVRTIFGSDDFSYPPTAYFGDVPSTYFAFPWIQKLYELGITAGCSSAPLDYCPSTIVTRDQMAIFLIRARYGATTPFTWNPVPYFTDVPSTYYAFGWIQRLYQDAITAGCLGTPLTYCPENSVTRGDMAIFLMRGGFNQLLPASAPAIVSISPATLTHGTTGTFSITGANTNFQQGATGLVFPTNSGITVNSVTVTGATSMQVSLTADSTASLVPVSIYEQTEPQEAVLPNGLLIQ